MRDSIFLIYVVNIATIVLLYLAVLVQSESRYLRWWFSGWALYLLTFVAYFARDLLAEAGLFSVYVILTQGLYYVSGILLFGGVSLLIGREPPRLLLPVALIVLTYVTITGIFLPPDIPILRLPAAATNAVIFFICGFRLIRFPAAQRLLLKVSGISFLVWGTSIAVHPVLYSLPRIMDGVYLTGGVFALVLAMALLVIHFGVVNQRVTDRNDEILYLTYHEMMTGLYNRNYLNMKVLHSNATDLPLPVSFVMADLDDLKGVNDNYGHKRGDEILIAFADILQGSLRDGDVAVRLGGDEFLLILPKTSMEGADGILRRIREKVSERHDPLLSFSAGVSVKTLPTETVDQQLQEADLRMYEQKRARHLQRFNDSGEHPPRLP